MERAYFYNPGAWHGTRGTGTKTSTQTEPFMILPTTTMCQLQRNATAQEHKLIVSTDVCVTYEINSSTCIV